MRPQNDLSFEIETQGPEHTQRVAAVLVQELGPGSVLALEGPLGAGKTTFVQGQHWAFTARGYPGEEPNLRPLGDLSHDPRRCTTWIFTAWGMKTRRLPWVCTKDLKRSKPSPALSGRAVAPIFCPLIRFGCFSQTTRETY